MALLPATWSQFSLPANRRILLIAFLVLLVLSIHWLYTPRTSGVTQRKTGSQHAADSTCIGSYIQEAQSHVDYRLIPLKRKGGNPTLPALIGTGTVLADAGTGQLQLQDTDGGWHDTTWANLIVGFSTEGKEASGLVTTESFVDAESGSIRRFTALPLPNGCAVVDERLFAVHDTTPALVQDVTVAHRGGDRSANIVFAAKEDYASTWTLADSDSSSSSSDSPLFIHSIGSWSVATRPHPNNLTLAPGDTRRVHAVLSLARADGQEDPPLGRLATTITAASLHGHEERYHRISRPFVTVRSPTAPHTPELHRFYLLQVLPAAENMEAAAAVPNECFSRSPLFTDIRVSLPQSLTSLRDAFVKQWDDTFSAGACRGISGADGAAAAVASEQLTRAVMGIAARDGGVDIAPGWLLPRDVEVVAEDVPIGGYAVDVHLTRHHTAIVRKDKRSHPVYIHREGQHPKAVGVGTRVSVPSDLIHISGSMQRPQGSPKHVEYGKRPLSPPSYSTSLIVFLFVAIAGFHVALIRLIYQEYCR